MASLEQIEIDAYCHPSTILWVGHKDSDWSSTVGDDLSSKFPERKWNPPIEINLAKIWNVSDEDFNNFSKKLDKYWSSMFLYLTLIRDPIFLDLRQGQTYGKIDELKYINNMIDVFLSRKGTKNLPYVITLER